MELYIVDNERLRWGVERHSDLARWARFEGIWRKSQDSGKGKFWHMDRYIFEGAWKEEKLLDTQCRLI